MQLKFNGAKYRFTINHDKRRHLFWIAAIQMKSKRTSNLLNLNPILSEFNVKESDRRRLTESTWRTRRDSVSLIRRSKELFSSSCFRKYLEATLDEDRSLGEWENVEVITK
jgi:hypothetical protein